MGLSPGSCNCLLVSNRVQERHGISNPVMWSDFDVCRLHSNFDDIAALVVHRADPLSQPVRVTHEDHTKPRRLKAPISSRTIAVMDLDQGCVYAHRAAINCPAGSNGIEIRPGTIQQGAGGSVEPQPVATEQLLQF